LTGLSVVSPSLDMSFLALDFDAPLLFEAGTSSFGSYFGAGVGCLDEADYEF